MIQILNKFNVQQIAATPAADFFSGLEEIRGIQVNRGGLVFNQVNIPLLHILDRKVY